MEHGKDRRRDFFVSYTAADKAWAEWIAWTLEAHGFQVVVKAWDSPAGSNWIQIMDARIRDAVRTIAVLSPDYLKSAFGTAEWQAAWAQDPEGTGQKLLPVRVSDCTCPGLLAAMVSIDLFGIDEETARRRLRQVVDVATVGRQKPKVAPAFPGKEQSKRHPPFPGAPTQDQPDASDRHHREGRESSVSLIADDKPRNPPDRTKNEEEAEEATVTDLWAFRLHSGRDSISSPDASLLYDLIVEISEHAELASASYSAGDSEYVWTRLELNRQLTHITSELEEVTQWLARAGLADDLATFSLRHSLRLYASTAEEFARTLDSLEYWRSSLRQRSLLAEYEVAWRSLRDLLWQIHRELVIVRWPPEPTGLR